MLKEIIDKEEWLKQAVIYGKTIVDLSIGDDLYFEDGSKRKWSEDGINTWILNGSPLRGSVIFDRTSMTVSCSAMGTSVVPDKESSVELIYPENPEVKYHKWYNKNHRYFSKRWLNFEKFLLRET
ncbi:MAG: hypothetical protein FIB08_13465 [Candidatus Methanoperedens sp.]|nr:hypothetical protein [Candidatus Methanoperedens sp.]